MSYDPEPKEVRIKTRTLPHTDPISLQIIIRSILKEKGIDINEPYKESLDKDKDEIVVKQ